MHTDDDYEDYDDERDSRRERHVAIVVIVAFLALVASGWWLRESDSGRTLVGYAGRSGVLRAPVDGEPEAAGTVGISGPHADVNKAPDAASLRLSVARSIEELEGGQELVGRRVNLSVPVQENANDNAFWIGSGTNQTLVVMRRDTRTEAQRQQGTVAGSGIAPALAAGQAVTISGTIQVIPDAEQRYSWGLTREEHNALTKRPLYIQADTVTIAGQTE